MSLLFGYSSGLSTIEEDINMNGYKITNLPSPSTNSEPVTKGYADTHYSSGGGSGQRGPKGDKGDTGAQGLKGDKGDTEAQGPKGDKGDTGAQGSKGDKGDTGAQGSKGDKGDTGAQGSKGDKGDTGAQGSKGDKGDTGAQGSKGDKGDTGAQGSKGDKGDTGAQGPKGDKGDTGAQGPKGDKGDSGSGGLSDTGFTMEGDINMNTNKITGLGNPTTNSEPVTKQYGDSSYLTDGGFVMNDNIGMGGHTVTNLGTPANNTDAATKKYVDDKKCKFKDGTTTTEVVDLRYDSVNNRFTFHNDIGFLKAYGTEINSSSLPATLVTLNSLQRGGLLGINSFSPLIKGLFPHRLIMAKGNVGNFTVIHKDQTVFDTNGVSLTSYASGIELEVSFKTSLPNGIYKYIFDIFLTSSQSVKVFLYGECGGTGYKATTTYKHWSGTAHGTEKQNNVHRMHGTHLHFSGSFRNYGKKIINYGRASAMNETGAYNEFVLQNLTANSDEPVVLGTDMTWEFENETSGRGLTFTTDSYFYIEKVQTM